MSTPPKPQLVQLLINGQVHADWTDLWVDSDLLTPADAFEFGLGVKGKTKLPAEVRKGAKVQVRVDDAVVMSGRLDARTHTISRRDGGGTHTVRLRGRDDMAALVDCSAPVKSMQNLTLTQIVEQIVKPLGINKIKFVGDKQYTHEKISVEPGESAWDALNKACEANGVAAWFAPDGTLTIGGPDYDAPPVATLRIMYDNNNNLSNVIEVVEDDSINGVYSEITVLGQSHGGKKGKGANQKAQATDPNIDWKRPKVVIESDCQDAKVATSRARKLLADGRLGGYTLDVLVPGYYTDGGVLWTPGQRVECQFEPLDTHAVFFLIGRKFAQDRQGGKYTRLKIKEDKMWVLDAKKPKQKKTGKARKVRKSIDKDIE